MAKETKKAASKTSVKPAADAPGAQKKTKKKLVAGMVSGVVVIQAAIIIAVKTTGPGPDEAAAAEILQALSAQQDITPEYHEVVVSQFRAPNEKSKVMHIYEVKVAVQVEEKNLERVKQLIERRKFALEDAFNRVIRGADPDDLREDDLEWLRGQFLAEVERAAETEGLINQLYIPVFMKRSAD